MSSNEDYFAALKRIIEGKTRILSANSSINKDTVALEAGRKRGSIKKSRVEHSSIIAAIEAAAAQSLIAPKQTLKLENLKQKKKTNHEEIKRLKKDYEQALCQIVSLIHQNHALQAKLLALTGDSLEK